MGLHVAAGTALLALVVFRILWGLAGSETARFAHFLRGPGAAWRHLRAVAAGTPDHEAGHNPAGGWMVVLILALLGAECLIGVFVNNDVADVGPFTNIAPAWVMNLASDLHWWLFQALIAAVVLHLAAIAFYAARGQNLVGAMVSGRKCLPESLPAPRMAGLLRALVLVVPAVAVALAVLWYG
jgi:cytochrome b